MADIVLTGVREMVARLQAKPAQVRDAAARGLYLFGERIMARSKEYYVPVKTGTLRRSGQVGRPDRMGDSVSVKLSYGGAASAYALVQHERTDYHHPHGQAKYLEAPLKLHGNQAGVDAFLAPEIRRALEHGSAR